MAGARGSSETIAVGGREVAITHPDRVVFPEIGATKRDLVRYYLAVAHGVLRAVGGRPMALQRFVHGVGGEAFFQKRAPENRPDWIETVRIAFPSGRTADEIVLRDAAQLAWVVNLGSVDLHPHPVRSDDLEHPDELRVDLDPLPAIPWSQVEEVALLVREVLAEHGLVGWPKTSGSRGMHVYVRMARRWGFDDVRRSALALAREVERRAPGRATSKWWKEERQGVFLDYNQNAKDRTTAAAYSVRPRPDARVSTPLSWDEVGRSDPAAFTIATVPARFAAIGDPAAGIDDAAGSLDGLLALADAQTAAGLPDAPWPPHYAKTASEPPRVTPSRRKKPAGDGAAGGTGRRKPTKPLLVIAQARAKDDALAGFERWKARHAPVVPYLQPSDVLVDKMRGRSSTWTRIRVNLEHVPETERPAPEPPDPDYDPWRGYRGR